MSTLFYKPERKLEDHLTHWFLSSIHRLEELRIDVFCALFRDLGFQVSNSDVSHFSINEQVNIGEGRRIDGIIEINDLVIGFENKIGDEHSELQLKSYAKLMMKKYDKKCMLLLTADRNKQSKQEIMSCIPEETIPTEDVKILYWQDVHRVMKKLSEGHDSKPAFQFILNELVKTLEKMNMRSYSGITETQANEFLNVKEELESLDSYLEDLVERETDCLRTKSGRFGSLAATKLTFPFDSNKTNLYFNLGKEDFGIGVRCPTNADSELQKLERKLSIEKLLKYLENLQEYELFGLTTVTKEGYTFNKIKQDETIFNNPFKLYRRMEISRGLDLKLMNTSDFKDVLHNEILRLKDLISLIDNILNKK